MKYLIIILCSLSLFACSETKKIRKATETFNRHPEVAAEYCGSKFPPVDSVVVRLDTVKANNVDYSGAIDSLSNIAAAIAAQKRNDSLSAARSHEACKEVVNGQAAQIAKLQQTINQLRGSYKPCDPDIIRKDSIIYRRNTAKEIDLQNKLTASGKELQETKDKLSDTKEGRSKWRLWCIVTWLLVGGYVALRIMHPKLPFKIS